MKRKMFSILLPILAGVTVIGTGFSIFYFVDDNASVSESVTATVEGYAELGSLNITNDDVEGGNFQLIFDSTTDGGIGLYYVAGTSKEKANQIELEYTLTLKDAESTDIKSMVPQITMTMSVPEAVDNYVKFGLEGVDSFTSTETDSIGNVYTYSKTLSVETSSPITITMPAFTFKYEEKTSGTSEDSSSSTPKTMEPMNASDWSVLSSNTTGENISITYTLAWVNKTGA